MTETKPKDTAPTKCDTTKYKTTLCRTWQKTGTCPYDFKCQFAHGESDLRERVKPAKPPAKKTLTRLFNSSWRRTTTVDNDLKKSGGLIACSKQLVNDTTPVCSPCASPVSNPVSPVPAASACSPPPAAGGDRLLATPPGLLATPPGLLRPVAPPAAAVEPDAFALEPPMVALRPPATVRFQLPAPSPPACGPIDLSAQSGAAGHFAAPSSSQQDYVPKDVRALWQDADAAKFESPLRCNRTTGKVEAPWLVRRMSSAGLLVRRIVSFGLDEGSTRSRLSSLSTRSTTRTRRTSPRSTSDEDDE